MAHVVNPIYDTVFKYIMQDEKVAKVLIGNILKTKVVSIQMNNNEYAAMLPDGKKVFKLDFSATILDKLGKQQLVHIEVQKALEEGEIMRFRHYLGAIYMDATKKYQETITNPKTNEKITVEHPLPIHTIYILGHELGSGLSNSVMHGENIFKDQDGNLIQIPENNDYINGLTHTVTFVIAPLTKKNVKTHLDRLLSIFSDCEPNKEEIEIDEYFDDSDDYRTLMKALQKASVDKQLRGNLELEQYEWAKQTKLMKNNAELRAQLSQQQEQLSQQQEQLFQKDAQLSAAIKALSATNSAEQIAKILDVSKQQVEMILKD
ncbi:MAG: hypothetical protein IKO99_07730 [Bacteroidales bacterium]|nr:hypothetical protein [Bacteroidales bacterium]